MSNKKDVKFDATNSDRAKQVIPCKTKCGRRGTVGDGWCSTCYSKYQKGYFTSHGTLSPATVKRQRELDEKRQRRATRLEERKLREISECLEKTLTPSILKILPVLSPESDKPKYCEKLSFWTSDTVCYSRLFITKHKKCAKCSIHNDSLESLIRITENIHVKTTAIAAAENCPSTDASREGSASTTASSERNCC